MASSSFWSNIFGQAPSDNEPSASVLAEWNKYSTDAAGGEQISQLSFCKAPCLQSQTAPASNPSDQAVLTPDHVLFLAARSCVLPKAVVGSNSLGASWQALRQCGRSQTACWARWRRAERTCRALCRHRSAACRPARRAWAPAWAPPSRGDCCVCISCTVCLAWCLALYGCLQEL